MPKLTLNTSALPVGPYVELEMIHESFNDIIPQALEPIPIAVVPASAVAIAAPGLEIQQKILIFRLIPIELILHLLRVSFEKLVLNKKYTAHNL